MRNIKTLADIMNAVRNANIGKVREHIAAMVLASAGFLSWEKGLETFIADNYIDMKEFIDRELITNADGVMRVVETMCPEHVTHRIAKMVNNYVTIIMRNNGFGIG